MGTCFCETLDYKEHFVCFHCRKMFKKTAYHLLPKEHQPATYADYQPLCPECHSPMINMGKEFCPPRKQDRRGWKLLKENWRSIQKSSYTSPQSWLKDLRASMIQKKREIEHIKENS